MAKKKAKHRIGPVRVPLKELLTAKDEVVRPGKRHSPKHAMEAAQEAVALGHEGGPVLFHDLTPDQLWTSVASKEREAQAHE